MALGVGGVAYGSIMRVSGATGAGKTSACMKMAVRHLASDRPVLIIDTEGGWLKPNALRNGISAAMIANEDPMFQYYSSQTYADGILDYETATQIVEDFLNACLPVKGDEGTQPLIIIDTISNLLTAAHVAADQGDSVTAATARANAQWMRTIWVLIKESQAAVILVEQLVANFGGQSFQSSTTTSGGNKIRHMAQICVELFLKQTVRHAKTGEVTHIIVGGKVEKNRWDAPKRTFEYALRFNDGIGIDRNSEILGLGVLAHLIDKGAAGYYTLPWDDEETLLPIKCHGVDETIHWLATHPSEAIELESKITSYFLDGEMVIDEEGNVEE